MRFLKGLLVIVAVVLLLGATTVAVALNMRPDRSAFASQIMAPDSTGGGTLRVSFLGVSNLLFDDGETAILTDGFFTRPGLLAVATQISPDSTRIAQALQRAGITRLAAVVPVHSHYDHVMDAPYVARWTGAQLVGSTSTANVGRGASLPEDRITVAVPGQPMTFGRFSVTLLPSRHAPTGRFLMPGEITSPLTPPARTRDYRLGESYSVVVQHEGRTILVQGSAGFIPGALDRVKADVVYLALATLGRAPPEYRDSVWNEVIVATGARRVIAVHWDDFTRPLSKPLVPLPRLMDDFGTTMRFLLSHTGAGAPDIRIPVEFAPTDPFADLPPS